MSAFNASFIARIAGLAFAQFCPRIFYEHTGVKKLGQKVCDGEMIHVLENASNSKS